MADRYERLQHRKDSDLPPLPGGLVRGTPESVLEDLVVQPVEILPDMTPSVEAQVKHVEDTLYAEARKSNPEFYAKDRIPTEDPSLQWMRDWRPNRDT